MTTKLELARSQELDPRDIALLWRFTAAHRPHDPAPTWRELRDEGLERIDEDSLLEIIEDQFLAEKDSEEVR